MIHPADCRDSVGCLSETVTDQARTVAGVVQFIELRCDSCGFEHWEIAPK